MPNAEVDVVSPLHLAKALAKGGAKFVVYGDLALFLHTGYPSPPETLAIAPKLGDERSFEALAAALNDLGATINGLQTQFDAAGLAQSPELDVETSWGPLEIRHYPPGVTRGMSGYDDLIRRPRTIHLAESK